MNVDAINIKFLSLNSVRVEEVFNFFISVPVLLIFCSSKDSCLSRSSDSSMFSPFAAFNAIYTQYFPNKPARTTFAASGLAKNAKIEIECIAVVK